MTRRVPVGLDAISTLCQVLSCAPQLCCGVFANLTPSGSRRTPHICHSERNRRQPDEVKNLPGWYAELTDDRINLDVDLFDVRYSVVIQTRPFDFVRLPPDSAQGDEGEVSGF